MNFDIMLLYSIFALLYNNVDNGRKNRKLK